MISLLISSAVDLGLDWVKPDYKNSICCYSAKHAALRRKSKRLIGSESG